MGKYGIGIPNYDPQSIPVGGSGPHLLRSSLGSPKSTY